MESTAHLVHIEYQKLFLCNQITTPVLHAPNGRCWITRYPVQQECRQPLLQEDRRSCEQVADVSPSSCPVCPYILKVDKLAESVFLPPKSGGKSAIKINLQSIEDTQVRYISQKYSFNRYTLGRAFKPSYTFFSI